MKKTLTMCAVVMAAIIAVFAISVYAQKQVAKGDGECVASAAAGAAVDKDANGACDSAKTCHHNEAACPRDGKECSQCPDLKDGNGDGVCDTRATCEKRTGAGCMSTQARCSRPAGAKNCHDAQPKTGTEKNASGASHGAAAAEDRGACCRQD